MFGQRQIGRTALFLVGLGLGCTASALAQQRPADRPYDGIQAGLEAFQLAEEQRQANAAQQLFLIDQLRFWNGLPPSGGAPVVAGGSPALDNRLTRASRANLDFAYGFGATYPRGAVASYWGPLAVFEPWPFVPGDIYGYPVAPTLARQPIGQQQLQTGPNRWESHPVYSPPLTAHKPLPPVDSPLLGRTVYAAGQPEPASAAVGPETIPSTVAPPTPALIEDPIPPPPPPPPALPKRGPREY